MIVVLVEAKCGKCSSKDGLWKVGRRAGCTGRQDRVLCVAVGPCADHHDLSIILYSNPTVLATPIKNNFAVPLLCNLPLFHA